MRDGPGRATLACMQSTTPTRRVIRDAAIERSVIRDPLICPGGERRAFHAWLELNTALEPILDVQTGRVPDSAAGAPTLDRFGVS